MQLLLKSACQGGMKAQTVVGVRHRNIRSQKAKAAGSWKELSFIPELSGNPSQQRSDMIRF